MRTRTKPSAKGAATQETTAAEATTIALSPSDTEPPRLAVLPKSLSDNARIVSLPDPATSTSKRYLVCPKLGFHEFTKVTAPRGTPRSWLLGPTDVDPDKETGRELAVSTLAKDTKDSGYLIKEPDLLIATPFDASLLLLPTLCPVSSDKKQLFLAFDDHLDAWAASSPHAKALIRDSEIRNIIESGVAAICDHVDAGEEKMYRLSLEKLAQHILGKAERASAAVLPRSMEEHFVKEALRAPYIQAAAPSDAAPKADVTESQGSADSGYASGTSSADDPTSLIVATPTQLTPSDAVIQLQRLRTALNFILSSYVPTHQQDLVRNQLSDQNYVDFSPLDAYLARLEGLKKQSQALRTLSDNISRKRSAEDDDEAAEIRAEKKRKKEEEDAKKKSETRALKQLKKVNTSGMQKLSSFFTKTAAK